MPLPAQASDEPMRAAFDKWRDSLGQESFGIRSVPNLPPSAWAAWQEATRIAAATPRATADVERDALAAALTTALEVIDDYLDYEHNGDPWTEDARTMGEMDINDYGCDGRMEAAKALLAATKGAKP